MMSYQKASKLLSQAMVVGEHPDEPMLIHGNLKLNDDFPFDQILEKDLLDKTQKFIKNNPRLCSFFDMHTRETPLRSSVDYKMMAERIWSLNQLSLDDFRKTKIDASQAPLIRFHLSKQDGFTVSTHHGLLDGRGLFHLLSDMLKYLLVDELSTSQTINEVDLDKKPSFLNNLSYYIAKVRELLSPPLMLADKTAFSKGKSYFYTETFSYERLKKIIKNIKIKYPKVTINDLLLASFHKSIYEKYNHTDFLRQGVMMPIDLRRHGRFPIYDNLSSGVNINCYKNDFKSLKTLLLNVSEQCLKAQRNKSDILALKLLKALRRFNIFEDSRNFLITTGYPRRCHKGTDKFWRFSSTAIFANMGFLKMDSTVKKYCKTGIGFPAVISPTGLAVTAIIFKDLTLNFHSSSHCMSEQETREFAKQMIEYIEQYELLFSKEESDV